MDTNGRSDRYAGCLEYAHRLDADADIRNFFIGPWRWRRGIGSLRMGEGWKARQETAGKPDSRALERQIQQLR
jgi:hypothetical protein